MQTSVIEKFEMALFNPATRQFEGGSWHAKITLEGGLNMMEVKTVRNVIDALDHSTIAPAEFISADEISKINKRFTLLRGCNNLPDMFIGISILLIYNVEKLFDPTSKVVKISYWRDNDDVEFTVSASRVNVNSTIVVEKHQN